MNLTSLVWVSKDWALMVSFIQARNVSLSFRPKNREPVTALNNFNSKLPKASSSVSSVHRVRQKHVSQYSF